MKLAKGEWAEQGWIWIASTLVAAIVWGRNMPVPWALLLHSGPFLVGVLLLLEVRWAPEFLIVVVAMLITILLFKIFRDGFTLARGIGLLCLGAGTIYPLRLLRASRPPKKPAD